jgi:hypothetical protein
MSDVKQTRPRIPLDQQLAARTRDAKISLYGQPWDRITEIKAMAARILEHPPVHPEKKRDDIIRKIQEIQRLADELILDMPKSKSRRGAVGLE